jgi:hypothetical protein
MAHRRPVAAEARLPDPRPARSRSTSSIPPTAKPSSAIWGRRRTCSTASRRARPGPSTTRRTSPCWRIRSPPSRPSHLTSSVWCCSRATRSTARISGLQDARQGERSAAHAAELLLRPGAMAAAASGREALELHGAAAAHRVRLLGRQSDEHHNGDRRLCGDLEGALAPLALSPASAAPTRPCTR